MNKLFQSFLLGSVIVLGGLPTQAADRDRDRGLSVSVGDIDANVGIDVGGRKGLDADVNVSVGDRTGLDAGADVSLGGQNGVDADVDFSLGDRDGLDADVGVVVGNGVGADVDVGLGATDPRTTTSGVDPDDRPDRPRLTTTQRQAFNRMSTTEKAVLLKRCGQVSAGGYDPALVELCKLLRMSAAR